MPDILCRVCGEPWDAYGVHHREDMTEEEAKIFLAGKGCPCCKGKKKGEDHTEEFLGSLIESTDEDPIDLLGKVE